MDITILPNGHLQLSLEANERDDLIDANERGGEMGALMDLTEPYWTNNSFHPFDAGLANPYVGITSAPCIAERMNGPDEENGKYEIDGRLWWFPAYETTGIVDELLKHGKVVFSAAPGWGLDEKAELAAAAAPSTDTVKPATRRAGR